MLHRCQSKCWGCSSEGEKDPKPLGLSFSWEGLCPAAGVSILVGSGVSRLIHLWNSKSYRHDNYSEWMCYNHVFWMVVICSRNHFINKEGSV